MTSMQDEQPSLTGTTPEEMRTAYDVIVLQGISPVSAWLGLLYAVVAVLHLLLLPPAIAQKMSLLAACTAATLIALRLVTRRKKIPGAWAYPLAALVSGLKSTREAGGWIKLAGMNPQVRNIFALTKLERVFELYPNVEAALSSN